MPSNDQIQLLHFIEKKVTNLRLKFISSQDPDSPLRTMFFFLFHLGQVF